MKALEDFKAHIEAAFPGERRGEWWTLRRVIELMMRDVAAEKFMMDRDPFPHILGSTFYEFSAEYIGERTSTELIDMVIPWYKSKGWLGCRLAHRYNVKGDFRSALAAAAWSEKTSQLIYKGDRAEIRHSPSEPLTDWLRLEMSLTRNALLEDLNRRYARAVTAEGRQ